MKYKNETDENIKYREGSYDTGFRWYTIRPGEIKDIPYESAKVHNLTKVESDETKPAEKDPKDDAGFRDSHSEEEKKLYYKKLIDINGVGPISAKEIIKKYPTEELLIKAVHDNEEVHKHDGIDASVKELYAV